MTICARGKSVPSFVENSCDNSTSSLVGRRRLSHSAWTKIFVGHKRSPVNLRPTSLALSSSPNPSNFGANVTLTGVVDDVSTTNHDCGAYMSGTVTFSDGANVLGSSPVETPLRTLNLSPSIATLSVSSLSGGSHQITAVYSGDQNFAAATAAPLTQVVNSSLGLAVGSGSSATATVTAGQAASYVLSIGGAGFTGVATIRCSLAVTDANCSVPGSVPVDQKVASNLMVTVTTPARWRYSIRRARWLQIVFGPQCSSDS